MPGIYSELFIGGRRTDGTYYWVCPAGYRAVARMFHVYCYSSVGSGAVAYAGAGPGHLVSIQSLAPGVSATRECRIVAEVGESFFVAVSNGEFGVHLSGFLFHEGAARRIEQLPAPGEPVDPGPPILPAPKS